jgi:excisionase family DNA binding protein
MFEEWPTKTEVRLKTGISERTIERKIQAGELRREFRNVPGRKPLAILDPADVKKLTEKTLTPIPMKKAATRNGANHGGIIPKPDKPDLAAFLAALSPGHLALDKKFYLTLKEAGELSGLPLSFLRAKVQTKELPAVKIGGWRIKRQDLERYDAATGKLTKVGG